MTGDLQQFRYDNLIRRVGGIIGPGSKVKEALSELFPVIDVERIPAELLWLSGWRMAFGGEAKVGAAAQTPRVELFNPVGSGKMIVVTDFVASSSVTGSLLWTTTNVALTDTVSPQRMRDTRRSAFEVPTGEIRSLSAAGTTVGTNRIVILANVPFHFRDDNAVAVLFPGTGLEVGHTIATVTLSVNFNWRERVIEKSEFIGV